MESEKDIDRYARIEDLLEQISLKHNKRPCDPTFMVLVTPHLMEFDEDAVVGGLLEILYLPKPTQYQDMTEGLYPDFGTILNHVKKAALR